MTTVALLHLSDIHIASAQDKTLKRAQTIAATLNGHPAVEATIVVVTGDVANSGAPPEYELALTFFSELLGTLKQLVHAGRVSIVLIPGNHDNDYREATGVRNMLVKQLTATPQMSPAPDVIDACTSVQRAFFRLMSKLEERPEETNRIFYQRRVEVGTASVQFHCFNTAWSEELSTVEGSLTYPVGAAAVSDTPSDIYIALLHHPLRWLPLCQRSVRQCSLGV